MQDLLTTYRKSIVRVGESLFNRGTSFLTLASVVGGLLGILQSVIAARLLGPASYGVVGLIIAAGEVFYGVLSPKVADAITRWCTNHEDELSRPARKAEAVDYLYAGMTHKLLSVLATMVVVFVFAKPVTAVFGMTLRAGLLYIYAFVWLPRIVITPLQGYLLGQKQFTLLGSCQLAKEFLQAVTIVGLLYLSPEPATYLLALLVSATLASLTYVVLCYRSPARFAIKRRPSLRRAWEIMRSDFGSFITTQHAATISSSLSNRADIIILGAVTTASQVGLYKVAKAIFSALTLIIKPIESIVYSHLSAMWSEGYAEFWSHVRSIGAITVPLTVLAGIGFLFMLEWAVPTFYGPAYAEGILFVQLLCVVNILWAALVWLRPTYMAADWMGVWSKVKVGSTGIMVVGFLVAGAYWGVAGVVGVHIAVAIGSYSLLIVYTVIRYRSQSEINNGCNG